jgi:chromosome condensin MukBEF MukE localization factor
MKILKKDRILSIELYDEHGFLSDFSLFFTLNLFHKFNSELST